jgi:hypothetical protein
VSAVVEVEIYQVQSDRKRARRRKGRALFFLLCLVFIIFLGVKTTLESFNYYIYFNFILIKVSISPFMDCIIDIRKMYIFRVLAGGIEYNTIFLTLTSIVYFFLMLIK